MNELLLIDSFLLALVVITAIAVVEIRSLYGASILAGVYSLLMALVWVNMHAVDVAFTEAAVGGGISTILLIGALVHTSRHEPSVSKIHWPALLITGLTGAALLYGTLDMPRFGDPTAPIHHHRVPEMVAQTVGFAEHTPGKQQPPESWDLDKAAEHPIDDFSGHVPNMVTSLLASYRGYDTMFETTVIFTAGISLILLLRTSSRRRSYRSEVLSDQVILRIITKLFIPFILVFGFYVISHGELGPGGGFQGGVILATAFILYALIFGRAALETILPTKILDGLCALGVLIYIGTGVASMIAGGNFLDYAALNPLHPGDAEALGMTIVEWGVGITVCSVMVTIFNQLTEEASA